MVLWILNKFISFTTGGKDDAKGIRTHFSFLIVGIGIGLLAFIFIVNNIILLININFNFISMVDESYELLL